MKKIFVLIIALVLASIANAQEKTLMVYTELKDASFIPYVNNEQMTMMPTDTFYYKVDTNIVDLVIHFPNEHIYDLSKKLNFDGLKHKKLKIVERKKIIKKLNDVTQRDKADTLDAKFMIKDESFMYYLKKLQN